MIRPETISGATLTMWASTNASSVIECVRRKSTQLIRGRNSDDAIRATTTSHCGETPQCGDESGDRRERAAAVVVLATGISARRNLRRLACTHGSLRMSGLVPVNDERRPGHRRLADSHGVLKAVDRNQVVVACIQQILLARVSEA